MDGFRSLFNIKFKYYDYQESPIEVGERALAQAATECVISADGWSVSGVAYCSISDVYDIEVGEELALTRALDLISGLTEDMLDQIWDDYYEWTNG